MCVRKINQKEDLSMYCLPLLIPRINLGVVSLADCVAVAMKNKRVKKRWVDAQVLITDEVSMLSQVYVCKVDAVARACRGSSRPMGGLKVILCGDFLQLPPVEKSSDNSRLYNCQWWSSMQIIVVLLQQCIRQLDADFALGLISLVLTVIVYIMPNH